MDISTLAPLVVSALVPLLQKGAEKITEKAAEEGFAQRGKIWNLVKGMFAEDELTLLNLFEQNPENVETQAELRGELKHLLKANPDIAGQIDELIKQIPQSPGKQNTINQSGSNNTAIQDVSSSTVNINQK